MTVVVVQHELVCYLVVIRILETFLIHLEIIFIHLEIMLLHFLYVCVYVCISLDLLFRQATEKNVSFTEIFISKQNINFFNIYFK